MAQTDKAMRKSDRQVEIDMSDEPMTIKEAAEFFKVDVQAMYKRVQRKVVQFHKDGRRLYFFKKELIAGLKAK